VAELSNLNKKKRRPSTPANPDESRYRYHGYLTVTPLAEKIKSVTFFVVFSFINPVVEEEGTWLFPTDIFQYLKELSHKLLVSVSKCHRSGKPVSKPETSLELQIKGSKDFNAKYARE
jgi:hypothetical protein